ncbi:MAG: hypothetical protein F6K19_24730 [Cyanothece sp. SIO1E1]|nr:hypothetical protein [Cyanothece sp. SIO1E1]
MVKIQPMMATLPTHKPLIEQLIEEANQNDELMSTKSLMIAVGRNRLNAFH